MSWLEFTASLVQSLAWPTVVLVLAIVLKGSLVDLILRLKRIKHKDTELEFDEQVKKIESTVAKRRSDKESVSELLSDLIPIAPRSAVIEAWVSLESLLYRTAQEMGKIEGTKRQNPFNAVIKTLYESEVLDAKTTRAIIEMRDLRNQVAHSEDVDINPDAAKRYAELAAGFSKVLLQQSVITNKQQPNDNSPSST